MNLQKILKAIISKKQLKQNKTTMKNFILLLITLVSIVTVNAQDKQKYIDEAYALIKIKSFNANSNAKKCDVYAYVRTGNHGKLATYYVELKRKATNEVVFRDLIDFKDLSTAQVAQSYRQHKDVYELFFGLWLIHEDTYMEIVAIEENGNKITIPVEFTNYKNPITIMN